MDMEPGVPRRPGDIRNTPAHGIPRVTPREGTPVQPPGPPIPPTAPTSPIVHTVPGAHTVPGVQAAPGVQAPPSVWGTPPSSNQSQPGDVSRPGVPPQTGAPSRTDGPSRTETAARSGAAQAGEAMWAGPDAREVYSERERRPSATGPVGARETSGVQVRLGARERERRHEREQRARRRARRSGGLVAAGVLILAGLVTAGLLLAPRPGDEGGTGAAPSGGERLPGGDAKLPHAGRSITVGTADGARYRIATVTGGVSDGVVTTFQSSPPSGRSFAYIEYILGNPTGTKVLLDFPGDVFVKRNLVTPEARGRCMPQAGVPEEMCTPPTKSQVVRRLRGGELISGDGGDKYMPPGSSYLVRATVDVPVERDIKRSDMGLYVWKQLYMADRLATHAPFPH